MYIRATTPRTTLSEERGVAHTSETFRGSDNKSVTQKTKQATQRQPKIPSHNSVLLQKMTSKKTNNNPKTVHPMFYIDQVPTLRTEGGHGEENHF